MRVKRHWFCPIFIVGLLIICPIFLHAQADTIDITQDTSEIAGFDFPVHYYGEDSTVFDLENELIYLYGVGSYVSYNGMELKAARIQFSFNTKLVFASGQKDSTQQWVGKPIFKDAENEFATDSLLYNFDTKKGISYGARTQEGEAYLIAGASKRQADESISVRNGMLTTCDKENPHYHFKLTKAVVIPNDKVVTGPFYMKVGKVPTPLALPFGFFPNKKESTSGILLPGYGNGGERGFFIQNLGYYLPLPPHLDTRILFDLYTRGSWSIRNITNYKKRYKYSGSFNISRTVNKLGLVELPSYFVQKTFNVRWTHQQDVKARPDQQFSANVNLGSSQNFRNNLNASQQDYLAGTFNSSVQWTKSFPGKPFNLAVSANHTQNTQTQIMQLTLPSVALNVQRINALKKIFPKAPIGISGNINAESLYSGPESAFTARNAGNLLRGASHGLRYNANASTSWKLGAIATINPSASYSLFQSFRTVEALPDPETQIAQLDTIPKISLGQNWNASLSLNSRVYGTWVMKNPKKLKAIRHVILPNMGVSYVPNQSYIRNGPYGADVTFISYSPFHAARYAPSTTKEAANINFGINQNIEAKVRNEEGGKISYKKVKLLEGFRTSTAYNTLADSLNWSNLQVSAFTTIGQNITLNYNSTHSFYDRDSLGKEVNQMLWKTQKRLTRMEGGNLAIGLNFRGKGKSGNQDTGNVLQNNPQNVSLANNGQNIDYSIPWNLRVNYNLRLTKTWDAQQQKDTLGFVQGVTFVGDVTLFKKWAISVNSGYDFKMKEFTPSIVGLHWDLHCWEFSFNMVPFGERKSYFAQLNVKASILEDLKIQRRGSLGTEQNYWD